MKNLIMTIAMLATTFAFAQPAREIERKKEKMETRERREIDPKTASEIRAKQMTLKLDLSDKQTSQVQNLLEKEITAMKADKLTKEEIQKLTTEQKAEKKNEILDMKINHKREMKKILSDDQYMKWENELASHDNQKRKGRIERRKNNKR